MIKKAHAAAGIFVLAAAVLVPVSPAYADEVRAAEWHLNYLKASEAQAITRGAGVVVGVVDSGVYPHPDLKRNLLKGTGVAGGGSGNGQTDTEGHGTKVASLIAADGSGSTGMLGIAPAAKILPIKISVGDNPSSSAVGDGISAAIQGGAKVINVSVGTGPSFEMADAINQATSADVVVVAGSGNDDQNAALAYPAAISGVLGVGSIGKDGKHSAFSVSGPNVGLCAPGEDIETAQPKTGYHNGNGTSFSTAIVSGAVALVRAKFPQLSAQDVIHRLEATADDNGPPGKDDQCGYGVLNIVKALTADVPPLSGSAGASSSPSAGATTTEPATGPTATSVAEPASSSSGSGGGWVVGGVVVVLVVAGAVGFWVLRRRSS